MVIPEALDAATARVTNQLTEANLLVVRTFDLQSACAPRGSEPCPHDGIAPCSCELVVLLVYGRAPHPVALVAHGHENQTWVSIVDTPDQPADPGLEASIQQVLQIEEDRTCLGSRCGLVGTDPAPGAWLDR